MVATVDEFRGVLDMASAIYKQFREKELIITDKDGELIC